MPKPSKCYAMLDQGVLGNLQQLGANLKTARFARDWSRVVVAGKIGVSVKNLKNAEDGSPHTPIGVYMALLGLYRMDDQIRTVACASSDELAANYKNRRAGRKVCKNEISFAVD